MKIMSARQFLSTALFIVLPLLARALDAGVSYAVFKTPDGRPYLEVNLEIAAGSIMYRHIDSTHLEAAAEVLILVRKGEEIVNYEKYILNSPRVTFPESLLDAKRLVLPPGQYMLDVVVTDVNDATNTDRFSGPLTVQFDNKITLTEVQLLRSFRADNSDGPFTKNGYHLEPLPFAFYDKDATRLAFYAEIYQADQSVTEGKYTVRYVIEKELGNGQKTLVAAGSQEKSPSSIDALLVQMDISKMESGNYSLTVELRKNGNELLVSRVVPFQRSNPFLDLTATGLTDEVVEKQFVQQLDKEQLVYCMRAISVLMTGDRSQAIINILKSGDEKQMRFYIFRHFAERDPNSPELAYRDYIAVADAANVKFRSGFRYGFETDRGRMFMRFGQASDIVHVEDEPGAPPYEIWVYYKFPSTNQTNVKFLFYNPSLAGDDFILLHSTARGEISNPKWERELYRRNPTEYSDDNYGDAKNVQRNNGRNARAFFEDF